MLVFHCREIRNNKQSNIIVGLSIALMAVLIIFLAGIDRTDNPDVCRVVAVLLHYFMLSMFFWMAVEAYNLYAQLIKVFDSHISHLLLKALIIGQGKVG